MRNRCVTAIVRCLGVAAMLAAVPVSAQGSLTVEGTEFVLTVPAGRTLRSADLVGATLRLEAGGTRGITATPYIFPRSPVDIRPSWLRMPPSARQRAMAATPDG
jgi:hypothetical protein